MATYSNIGTGGGDSGGSSVSPQEVALARAQELLGPTVTRVWGSDFMTTVDFAVAVGATGAAPLSATLQSGVQRLSTGATAGSYAVLYTNNTGGSTGTVDNPKTRRWYSRAVARVQSAVDGQALIYVAGIKNGLGANSSAYIGVEGPSSTAFFTLKLVTEAAVPTAVVTAVAIDMDWHLFEIWSDGTTVSAAIDGTVVATTPASNLGNEISSPRIEVTNNATAANRAVDVDLFMVCYEPILAGA